MKTSRIYFACRNAFAGLSYFFRNEHNGRLQLFIGSITIILSTLLHLAANEWVLILVCIGAVLTSEMMNSALEKLCDHVQPLYDPQIKIIKDVAAGAVLFISIMSSCAGAIIFMPKIWQLL